jgi:predicted dehydrogenase
MRLLILGTGGMANIHAANFAAIDGVSLVGGVDVDPLRLAAFCAEHGIARQFGSLEEALAWGQFDAVANVGRLRSTNRFGLSLRYRLRRSPRADRLERP